MTASAVERAPTEYNAQTVSTRECLRITIQESCQLIVPSSTHVTESSPFSCLYFRSSLRRLLAVPSRCYNTA